MADIKFHTLQTVLDGLRWTWGELQTFMKNGSKISQKLRKCRTHRRGQTCGKRGRDVRMHQRGTGGGEGQTRGNVFNFAQIWWTLSWCTVFEILATVGDGLVRDPLRLDRNFLLLESEQLEFWQRQVLLSHVTRSGVPSPRPIATWGELEHVSPYLWPSSWLSIISLIEMVAIRGDLLMPVCPWQDMWWTWHEGWVSITFEWAKLQWWSVPDAHY